MVTAGFLFTGGAWKAECSRHLRSWKLMNFHIMKACVMQMEARTAILESVQKAQEDQTALEHAMGRKYPTVICRTAQS